MNFPQRISGLYLLYTAHKLRLIGAVTYSRCYDRHLERCK
jgi:hypothetical protein